MKSPMVERLFPHTAEDFTHLMVLQSAASYFVGTLYKEEEICGGIVYSPGSRDSDYFEDRESAQRFLDLCEAGNPFAIGCLRDEP